MKKYRFYIAMLTGLALFCLDCSFSGLTPAGAKGVKTSIKRYSIFKYKNQDVLCEPYTVQKNDWLYKIFRQKGEISEKDFPYFLRIFKELNPQISNIDAIDPGNPILIPLKIVQKKDYDLSTPSNVDVPVIEFSSLPDEKLLEPFYKKHTIQRGDTLSHLIDKEFLQQSGRISEEGIKAFQLANPNIQNINIIHEGDDIRLPDPAIRSQSWFRSFFAQPPEKPQAEPGKKAQLPPSAAERMDELKLLQLKKYASLIGGTLLSQGKVYFPGQDGAPQVLDLSQTPVVETEDGEKILILSGTNQNDMLLRQVESYWKDLRVQTMSGALENLQATLQKKKNKKKPNLLQAYKDRVALLLDKSGYEYVQDTKIPFMLNSIQLEASFGRIYRNDATDILINFGNVYGKALDVLKKKEFDIISISPKLKSSQLSDTLFSNLGYATWQNPSFFTGKQVEVIKGVYAVKGSDKLFIPDEPLSATAVGYLEKEAVTVLPVPTKTILK